MSVHANDVQDAVKAAADRNRKVFAVALEPTTRDALLNDLTVRGGYLRIRGGIHTAGIDTWDFGAGPVRIVEDPALPYDTFRLEYE